MSAGNPFVGLRPFGSGEALLFFGRREQTVDLLERLHRHHFIGVVGSSGCGKSSLIYAGLIPKLKAGMLVEDRDRWLVAAMKPGSRPRRRLAAAILESLPAEHRALDAAALGAAIAASGAGAVLDLLAPALADTTNLLLLVDQFEEIFRFGGRREEAVDFVSSMLALAAQRALPVYVVMTMRSDFLGDCDAFRGLPEALNESQYLVPRLTRGQRREAIEGPVRLYGGEIAPRLVDRLLNDAGEGSDQLPVMQHALMRLWAGGGGVIDVDRYAAIGTLDEALSRHAEEALEGMEGEDLELAESLFRALTRIDPNHRRIRRPRTLAQIVAETGGQRHRIVALLEAFRSAGRSFIMPPAGRPLGDDSLIDVSHESLIRRWERLRLWVDAEAEDGATYRRLADAARRHAAGRGGLLADLDLELALQWRDAAQPREAWAERYGGGYRQVEEFLDESRRRHARKRARARFLRLAASAVALTLLAVAALFALWRQNAGTQQRIYVAREELAAAPRDSLETTLAATDRFLAPATFGHDLKALLREGIYALRSRPLWTRPAVDAVGSFAWSADGHRLASADGKGTVTLWAAGTGEVVARLDAAAIAPLRWLAADGEGRRVAVFGDGAARLWTPADDRAVALAGVPERVDAAAFSPDGALLAAVGDAAGLRLWRTEGRRTGEPGIPAASARGAFLSLAWSPDGRLALGDDSGQVRLARLGDGGDVVLAEPFDAHTAAVHWLGFSADGDALASAGADRGFRLWDAGTWQGTSRQGTSLRHDKTVIDAAFSDDGHYLVTLDRDDQVRVWNRHLGVLVDRFPAVPSRSPASGEQPVPGGLTGGGRRLARRGLEVLDLVIEAVPAYAGHEGAVRAVALDGRLLATAGDDGTVRLWEPGARGGPRVFDHDAEVRCVALSGDGRWLASGGSDGTVRLWDPATDRPVHTLTEPAAAVLAVVFSPRGDHLTGADRAGTIRTWTVASGELAREWQQAGRFAAVAPSPGGESLVAVDDGGAAVVWDLATGEALHRLVVAGGRGHEGPPRAVALGPDGRRLATAGDDLAVLVWDAASGRMLFELDQPGYLAPVTVLGLSADGRRLAAAGRNVDRILVWDAAAGVLTDRVPASLRGVRALALSGDGSLLVSAGGDGLVHVDPLDLAGLTDLAEHRLGTGERRL